MSNTIFLAALTLGLASSLHCLGMCGPLVLALPGASRYKNQKTLVFLLAKAVAYASLGLAAGLIGEGFRWLEWQQLISVLAGIFLILWTLIPEFHRINPKFPFVSQYNQVMRKMQKQPRWSYYIALGYLNGFLPCGAMYVALAASVAADSVWGAALSMFIFGVGTIPALFVLFLLRNKLTPKARRWFKPLSKILICLVGILLILRGANLNIPFISPAQHTEASSPSCH